MQVTNNTKANYEALLNAIKGMDGNSLTSESVKDVSVVSGDAGITISFNAMIDGKEVPLVMSMPPELDAPEGVADDVELGDLLAKLEGLNLSEMTTDEVADFLKEVLASVADQIEEKGLQTVQLPSTKSTGGSATLFNLFEILSLLIKAAQEISKASYAMKAADNEMQAQSYERQASKTMAMAEVAKAQSAKYTTISVCMMAVSAAVSIGVGVASAVKGVLSDTKAAGVSADMSKSVTNSEVTSVNVTTSAGKSAVKGLSEGVTVESIKNTFNNDQAVVDARAHLADANTRITTAENTIAAKQTALDQAIANNPVEEGAPEPQAVTTARNELNQARTDLQTAKDDFAQAKSDFKTAVMNVKNRFDSSYIDAPKAEQKGRYNDMVVANEIAFKTLKTEKVGAGENQTSVLSALDMGKITNACDKSFRIAKSSENHWVMQALGSGATFVGQLATTLNQHWQAEVNYQSQAEIADAQREQADATRKQKDYDEDKELQESTQNVIDAARQTLAKTYESQHQTTREIFG